MQDSAIRAVIMRMGETDEPGRRRKAAGPNFGRREGSRQKVDRHCGQSSKSTSSANLIQAAGRRSCSLPTKPDDGTIVRRVTTRRHRPARSIACKKPYRNHSGGYQPRYDRQQATLSPAVALQSAGADVVPCPRLGGIQSTSHPQPFRRDRPVRPQPALQ